ncbi:DUF4240 domain-containing protein [Streptomyces sp. NBC_00986]|uniref:DUF4240 domain-containing protein n=1 Tax=Streptomyces sp. NBC_00986 TaxID=2903702 RepID=UPI0038651902|nr:DUF4240 domain-containing protein [Streptomyces sp. NBC_00986]
MDIDSFWGLIEECRRQARGRDGRLTWLRGELSRRPLTEIVGFQVCLDEVTYEASTRGLWAAADLILGGRCSDDGFCCFGLWMVGLGRDVFRRAVTDPDADPDALADAPEIHELARRPRELWNDDWPDWESLDYVAMEAYGIVTGVDDDGDAFDDAVEAEKGEGNGGSGPLGERRDVRDESDEGEAAHRLPRLSVMFPARPRSRSVL